MTTNFDLYHAAIAAERAYFDAIDAGEQDDATIAALRGAKMEADDAWLREMRRASPYRRTLIEVGK